MGLDITAYEKVEWLRELTDDDDGDGGGDVVLSMPDFPEHADGLKEGIYRASGAFRFRAGSYGGYNRFREALAEMVGYTPRQAWDQQDEYKDRSFFPLVCFSDCEGTIGPETSARLARDFAAHADKAATWCKREGFPELYAEWRHAFELAAGAGAVTFH